MPKFFYGVAIFCFAISLLDFYGATPGSARLKEAIILLVLSLVFSVVGVMWERNAGKKCRYCGEKVKKDAIKCKHCHSDLAAP